jgi:hypothetical protein
LSCSLSRTTNSLFPNACIISSNSAWICSIEDLLFFNNACFYLVTHNSISIRNLAVFCLLALGIFVILSKNFTPLRSSSIILAPRVESPTCLRTHDIVEGRCPEGGRARRSCDRGSRGTAARLWSRLMQSQHIASGFSTSRAR